MLVLSMTAGLNTGHHACLMPWGGGRRVSRKTAGYWLPSVTAVSAISPLFQNQPLDVKPLSLTVAFLVADRVQADLGDPGFSPGHCS